MVVRQVVACYLDIIEDSADLLNTAVLRHEDKGVFVPPDADVKEGRVAVTLPPQKLNSFPRCAFKNVTFILSDIRGHFLCPVYLAQTFFTRQHQLLAYIVWDR